MNLTSSHLKYLLAIYEIAKKTPDVSSSSIAKMLSVSKPSVSTMLVALQERKLLVKQRYGKVYLTDTGYQVAKQLSRNVDMLSENLPKTGLELTSGEIHKIACIVATEMPGKNFAPAVANQLD